jgi:sugar phosphate isomerase/epimerase
MALYGYNSNGFASHRLEEALIILAENGMRAVAITPDVPHLDPRTSTSSEVKNIAKLCKDLNLVVIIETGARYVLDSKRKHRPNLLESDESRMVRIRFLQQMLEWCDIFESPVLSFWSGTLPEGQDESLARCLFLDAVCSLKNSAPKTLEFAIEPEPGHLISTLSDFTSLEPELPAGVGLCLDIGHLLVNDVYTPAEAIKKHADIIKTVQLDDMPRGRHEHCPPGEGDVNWDETLHAIETYLPKDICACFELSRDSHRFHELIQTCSKLVLRP